MQLPHEGSNYLVYVRYGRYVARRLKRAGLAGPSADLLHTTTALRTLGRAVDDAEDAIQDALADRDGADDALHAAAQEARNALAGRSVNAVHEEPYTLIFEQGIGYFTAAPLDAEQARYAELVERLAAHLPANDAVRKHASKVVHTALGEFDAGEKALTHARTSESMLATKLRHAIEKWELQVEKLYGLLVADHGRAAVERFFPRQRAASRGVAAPAPPASPSAPTAP